jgi:phage portal protein BeeE
LDRDASRPRGSQTSSGVWVNPDTALRYTAVLAAVHIIAESVAMLPLNVYRRMATGGKELAVNHSLFSILSSQPNDWQTSFEWREMMTAHVLLARKCL